jgi:hypothetical protein
MMTMISRKNVLCLALAAVIGLGLATGAWAQGNPLSLMPESAQAAVFLPSVDFVEKQGAVAMTVPGVKDNVNIEEVLGDLPTKLGVKDPSSPVEVFKAAGLSTDKPLAVFLATNGADSQTVAAALPVADEAVAAEKMKLIFTGKPEEITVGEAKGLFLKDEDIGYSIQGGYVFIGSTPEMIGQVAAKVKSPVTLAYMKSNAPQEVAVITSIDRLLSGGILKTTLPSGANLAPTIDYLKSFIDEIVLGIGEQNGEAYVRVGMHDPTGAVAAPASALKLHALFAGEAPIMVDLRNNAALIEKARLLMMANPALAKVGTYVMLASSMLGDELALAITGITGNIPDGIIAATLAKPEQVKGLLGLAGIDTKAGPKYQQNGADVYVKENVTEGVSVYIALAGSLLLVSTNEATLKKAVDGLNPDGTVKTGTSTLDPKLLAAAANGFVVLDPSKIPAAQLEGLPSEVKELSASGKKIVATLGNNSEWRELRVAVPGGFAGVAETVNKVTK